MTFKTLKRQSTPSQDTTVYFDDPELQIGNITIDQDGYTTGLDREYDVRGKKNMHLEVKNTGSTNALIYRIERTNKNFVNTSEVVDADYDKIIKPDTDVLTEVKAFGTITLAGVLAGDIVTVNGLVYTAVAGAKANSTEFSIDGTDTVDAADLADSIQNDTRVGILDDLTATSAVAVVTATQTRAGTGGNATTLSSSNGARLAVSGATFSGGVDDNSLNDIIDISPETSAIRLRVKRKTSGQNTTLAGITKVN